MDIATRKHLDDLAKEGFDVSSLETQINNNPVLEKVAERRIGGGMLRLEDYSRFMGIAKQKEIELENKVKELAALHDSANSLKGNEDTYNAALQVIADQEAALITAGFDEEEVKNLSFVNKTKLVIPAGNKDEKVIPKSEDKTVDKIDEKTYIDAATFNKEQEKTIFNNIAMTSLIQEAYDRARTLGIKVLPEVSRNLATNLFKGTEAGKSIDQIFDEQFGFSAAEKVAQEAAQKKEVEEAFARGRAEGKKEEPYQRSVTREKHPVFDSIQQTRVVTKENVEELRKNIPVNKHGDQEFYRLRGGKENRIASAADYSIRVQEHGGSLVGVAAE